jgi:chromosome segregation ATPase
MASNNNNGGRSWFEGTMEVISGMAPRPSTPQPYPQPRSISAPNSPARQGLGHFPGINRLPSQDSLDRSIHNESGHGKSTAQIIRDLKASNNALMAKTASTEAKFMNEINSLTKSFEDRQKNLELNLRKKDKHIATMEAWKIGTEQKLKEKDAQLSKIKEESAFQRHTISDLKNQLYQIQTDMEEAQYEKRNEWERLMGDNQAMAKQLSIFQQQAQEGMIAREQLDALQVELEGANRSVTLRDTRDSDHDRGRSNHKQLAIELRAQLEERDDTIAEMQIEMNKYVDQVAELSEALAKVEHVAESQEYYRRDEAEDLRILHDAQEVEIQKLREDFDAAQGELELRDQELEEKDREIVKQRELAQSKQEESRKLATELEDLKQNLELKTKEVNENEKQLQDQEGVVLERGLPSTGSESRDDIGLIGDLQEQVRAGREALSKVEKEFASAKDEHRLEISALQASGVGLESEKTISATRLSEIEKELAEARAELKEKELDMQEMGSLRKEIEMSKKRLKEKVEAEQAALDKAREFKESLAELNNLRAQIISQTQEIAQLRDQLEKAESRTAASKADAINQKNVEIKELRDTINKMGSSDSNAVTKIKKQLREAQVALVAVDDEKKKMSEKHRELVTAVEKKKDEIKREFGTQLESKEKKISELEQQASALRSLEASNERLELEVKELQVEIEVLKSCNQGLEGDISTLKSSNRGLNENSSTSPSPEDADLTSTKQSECDLLASLRSLEREKESQVKALKQKLKDRDTTITALVRSSVSLEKKIEALEAEVEDARVTHSARNTAATEEELDNLRNRLEVAKEGNAKLQSEVSSTQKELHTARADGERWRTALEDDFTTGGDYRYQISVLKKEAEENTEKLQERDRAIENLVNQCMAQESHVKELKNKIASLKKDTDIVRKGSFDDSAVLALRTEIRRLQQESEIFAGQIIEQDEELETLKRSLHLREEEVFALKKEISELDLRSENVKIIERDEVELKVRNEEEVFSRRREVSLLQAEVQTRDVELAKLKSELEALANQGPSKDSQRVLDLQAELDELQEANQSNRAELRDLRRQLWEAKEAAGEASDLKVELAQAKYALEQLKRDADESKSSARSLAQSEIEEFKRQIESSGDADRQQLKKEVRDAVINNKALEEKMVQDMENLRKSKNEAVEKLEAKLKAREATIKQLNASFNSSTNEEQIKIFQMEILALRKDLAMKTDALQHLRREMTMSQEELREDLKRKAKALEEAEATVRDLKTYLEHAETAKKHIERELAETIPTTDADEELKNANVALEKEIATLRFQMESMREERETVEELRAQLHQEKEIRTKSEKSVVDSYERQLSLLNMDKDVTIDELRTKLAASRGQSSEDINDMVNGIRMLESENAGLREQLQAELQSKNQQIYALEHTVHAQEQLVENMRMEMDQLQNGMEHATSRRRGEVEEMQQEVMAIESRSKSQEREILALKMQLEEKKLEHKEEVFKLRGKIENLEKESPLAKTVAELQNDDRMLEVRQRLEQLKQRNTSLQEENLKLGGRLERAVIEIKSLDAEREHMAGLEKDVARLTHQVRTLEGLLASVSRQQPQETQPPPPSRAPSPATTPLDKENKKDKKTKKNQPGGSGFRLFKRKDDAQKSDQRTTVTN